MCDCVLFEVDTYGFHLSAEWTTTELLIVKEVFLPSPVSPTELGNLYNITEYDI